MSPTHFQSSKNIFIWLLWASLKLATSKKNSIFFDFTPNFNKKSKIWLDQHHRKKLNFFCWSYQFQGSLQQPNKNIFWWLKVRWVHLIYHFKAVKIYNAIDNFLMLVKPIFWFFVEIWCKIEKNWNVFLKLPTSRKLTAVK